MAGLAAVLGSGTLKILDAAPATLAALLHNVPAAIADRPNDEGWTIRDVLARMISMERPAVRERVRAMLEHENPTVQYIDEGEALEASQALADRKTIRDASMPRRSTVN